MTLSPAQRRIRQEAWEDRAIRSLADFVRVCWSIVEPGRALRWNWHLDIICDALQRQIEGDLAYRKLLITVPPGAMKSLLVAVFAPAWAWIHHPERRTIFLSNDDVLVKRDSRRTRQIITSPLYTRLLHRAHEHHGTPEPWGLERDQNEKTNFENNHHGFRQCLSINASITGKRADDIAIDDPLDAKAVVNGSPEQIQRRLLSVQNVIDQVLPSRVNDLARARWTLIMQRLHEDDPAAHAMAEGGWQIVNLPMSYNPDHPVCVHPDDPRTTPGELLFPDQFPQAEIDALRVKLGERHYAGQYEQAPTPAEGGLFKRAWFSQRYPLEPKAQARLCREVAISVDCSFRDTRGSDYTCLQVWGRSGSRFYLLDRVWARMDFPALLTAFKDLIAAWPEAGLKLIEAKANGDALIQIMRGQISGLVGYDPRASKYARAQGASLAFEAGQVWLPAAEHAPWIGHYIEELVSFPGGSNDDQVDATSQILIRWTETPRHIISRSDLHY